MVLGTEYSWMYLLQCELTHCVFAWLVASPLVALLASWTSITSCLVSPERRIRTWSWLAVLSACALAGAASHVYADLAGLGF